MSTNPVQLPDPTRLFDLSGKSALVTGAGRGIGKAAARALAGAGATVTLVARTATEIESAAAEIRTQGGKGNAVAADLSDLDAVEGLAAHGPFNILFNNAGINRPETFADVSEDGVLAYVSHATPTSSKRSYYVEIPAMMVLQFAKKDTLQDLCDDMKIPTSGTKDELLFRIMAKAREVM